MRLDGFVLAGGRSSRMGADKARLPFPERWPMATHVASVLAEVCDRVVLVRRGPPDGLPWPRPDGGTWEVVRDPEDGAPHPLTGLATVCAQGTTPYVLVVPCDVPFLPAEGVRRLVERLRVPAPGADPQPARSGGVLANAVVAHDGTRVHPLVGVFPRGAGPLAEAAARAGQSARDFVAEAARVTLPAAWLRNVNRWEDTGRESSVVEALVADLPWLDAAERQRLCEGEAARLAARGAVDVSRR